MSDDLARSLNRLVEVALRNRDAILDAIHGDACDADYKKRVDDWPLVGGAYPAGRVAEVHATLFPGQGATDFDKAFQAANYHARQPPAAAHLPPKIEAVSDAHHAMLDAALAIGQGDATGVSTAWQSAEMAINEAVNKLLPYLGTSKEIGDEARVYQRIREHWDKMSDAEVAEIANHLAACVAKRRQFTEWFRDATTDEDKRLSAASMWSGFPGAGGVYRKWQAAKGSDRYRLIAAHAETLVAWSRSDHEQAVRFIMRDCEAFGISSQALWEGGRVCREIFASTGLPMQSGAVSCDWPACLGDGRYQLPQAMQDAIREGEAVYQSWLTKISTRPAKGGRPDEKPPRRKYAQRRSPPEWLVLLLEFEAEVKNLHDKEESDLRNGRKQKDHGSLTEDDFAKKKGIKPDTLRKGFESARALRRKLGRSPSRNS